MRFIDLTALLQSLEYGTPTECFKERVKNSIENSLLIQQYGENMQQY